MAILFPLPSSKARVRAMNSANWAEVPGGRGLASGLKIGDYCIPGSSFSIQHKAAFINVPDFLRIGQRILGFCPIVLRVLSNCPRFLGKSERGESPQG